MAEDVVAVGEVGVAEVAGAKVLYVALFAVRGGGLWWGQEGAEERRTSMAVERERRQE